MSLRTNISEHALYRCVVDFIRQEGMLEGAEHIDVALSGGADSVCLAAVLSMYCEVPLRAHHIRHGLRDDDGFDAKTAREVAERLGIEFIETDLSWPDGVPQSNVEEQARERRYGALLGALKDKVHAVLALAHHGDENLETMIWRLGRGCGIEGACLAMKRDLSGVRLIRPLLMVSKAEIYSFLEAVGLPWAEDPTNQSAHYRRNRIRHEILPGIRQEAMSASCLYRSLVSMRHDAECLVQLAEQFVNNHPFHCGCWFCPWTDWNSLGREASLEVLRHAARLVEPSHCPDASFVFRAVDMLSCRKQSHRWIENGCIEIGWFHGGVMVCDRKKYPEYPEIDIEIPCTEQDIWGICRLSAWRMIPESPIRNTTSMFVMDWDVFRDGIIRIRPASFFYEMKTSVGNVCRVKEQLRRQGVPEQWQTQWPVLCCGDKPLWIFGGMRTLDAVPASVGKEAVSFLVSWRRG